MVVRFIWASRLCNSFDSGIVRNFRVDLVLAAIGTHDDSIVDWIVDSIVYSIVGSIVYSIVGSIVGSVFSTVGSKLSRFLFLTCLVVNGRSAVAGTTIYMPSVSFLASVQEDGKVMEHCPLRDIIASLPKSK